MSSRCHQGVLQILSANGIDFPVIDSGWSGTPPLTTVPRWNAAERLFVMGDAAGYVEPFTGEGDGGGPGAVPGGAAAGRAGR